MKRLFKKKPKHKDNCPFSDAKITIIHNAYGQKVSEWHYKYCFFCGTKLK